MILSGSAGTISNLSKTPKRIRIKLLKFIKAGYPEYTIPRSRMDISSLINVYIDSEIKKTGQDQVSIKPGDVFRLRILEILSDQRVAVDFGKFQANAEIKFPVHRGEEYVVKVVDTAPQFRLRVIHFDSSTRADPNRSLGKFNFLSDELLQRIRLNIQQAYNQIQHRSDTKNLPQMKAAIETALSDMNNLQSLTLNKQFHPEPFQLFSFLPPLMEKDQKLKLKLYCPKKKKDAAKNGFKISILLNMNHMGEIRTDLFLLDDHLTITFFVKNEKDKKAIERHCWEINTTLAHLFENLIIRTVISGKKINDFHREDWNFSENRYINVRI